LIKAFLLLLERVSSKCTRWASYGLLDPVQVSVSIISSLRVHSTATYPRIFRSDTLLPIPKYLSYEEAATIPCAAVTAWNALFEKKPLTKDSTVLVLGSGGVSVLGAQLAKAAGARVIATTSSKEKEEKYKKLGVDHVINYRENPEWSEKIRELTGRLGVEQVLEVG
jgi:NADPH:quinone reductase-like Zn-dependent oxidoreductase